ncbi:hypothetical protein GPALN_007455 [Globodera pallida]|nr:hypothetical protein GPALN_007455 [Globodera pallida]
MHDRLLSNECWGFVLGAAAFDPDCKAFMARLKDYLEDSSILMQKAVCVPVGDTESNVKGMFTSSFRIR